MSLPACTYSRVSCSTWSGLSITTQKTAQSQWNITAQLRRSFPMQHQLRNRVLYSRQKFRQIHNLQAPNQQAMCKKIQKCNSQEVLVNPIYDIIVLISHRAPKNALWDLHQQTHIFYQKTKATLDFGKELYSLVCCDT